MANDGWLCSGGCGSGVCVLPGTVPKPSQHVLRGGKVCGKYVYEGPCPACMADDERERRVWEGKSGDGDAA